MSKKREILGLLKRDELAEAVELFGLTPEDRRKRDALVDALVGAKQAKVDAILEQLSRERLKELCRELELDDTGRAKAELIERLTNGAGGSRAPEPATQRPTPRGRANGAKDDAPVVGEREPSPAAHVPDAWIDEDKTRVGYEIPFTRHFYEYKPLRPLAEIEKEIRELESEIQGMLGEVVG